MSHLDIHFPCSLKHKVDSILTFHVQSHLDYSLTDMPLNHFTETSLKVAQYSIVTILIICYIYRGGEWSNPRLAETLLKNSRLYYKKIQNYKTQGK